MALGKCKTLSFFSDIFFELLVPFINNFFDFMKEEANTGEAEMTLPTPPVLRLQGMGKVLANLGPGHTTEDVLTQKLVSEKDFLRTPSPEPQESRQVANQGLVLRDSRAY